jgi:hypothetical protein
MSVTWLDPPGSTLESKDDAIDFSVTAAPPASASPVTWGAVYSVDFTALTAQPTLVPGPVTIDGLRWWLKGALRGPVEGGVIQSSSLEPGAGLHIRSNFGSEGSPTLTYHLRYFLRLSAITGYNPLAPAIVVARVAHEIGSDMQNTIVGVCEGEEDALALSDADRVGRVGCGADGAVLSGMVTWQNNGVSSLGISPSTAADARMTGVHLLHPTRTRYVCYPWSGSAPDPYASPELQVTNMPSMVAHASRNFARLGVYFTYNFNGGATRSFWMRNLYVIQPKAVG